MITTVTLNPALDRMLSVDEIVMGEANRVKRLCDTAAGKGVDVTKVLRDLSAEVTCTGFLGGAVSSVFIDCFTQIGAHNQFVRIEGITRTNLQIFDGQGRRTELLEQGPSVTAEEFCALMERVEKLARESSVVTICGSAPRGISLDDYRRLIRLVKGTGAITVVDASGALLRAALEEKPHLIKPNRYEMRELMGDPNADQAAIRAFSLRLVEKGVPYVLVSLGKEGAMLACKEGVYLSQAPDVPVKSTLGCGDTMVASMALSFEERCPPSEMLRRAVALSSANAMTFETAHIDPQEYRRLMERTTVSRG